MSRELRKMGYRKLSARPRHHAQAEGAIADFKKVSRAPGRNRARKRRRRASEIEIWFEDEARIGQKNKITRRWAKRGSRPSAPHDQRTASTYIFGAICPKDGKGAALVLPACNTYAMNLLLAEIAKNVAADAHAVLIVDHAGWHMTDKLVVPAQHHHRAACRRNARNSTRPRTSGSSCATIGSRTASSNPTTISSTIAATHGTSSSSNHGASCPSDYAIGRTVLISAGWYKMG